VHEQGPLPDYVVWIRTRSERSPECSSKEEFPVRFFKSSVNGFIPICPLVKPTLDIYLTLSSASGGNATSISDVFRTSHLYIPF